MHKTPRARAVTSGCNFDRSVTPLLNNISNEKTKRKKKETRPAEEPSISSDEVLGIRSI